MARKRENISSTGESAKDKRTRKRYIVYANEDGTPDLNNLPPELEGLKGASNPAPSPENSATPTEPPPPAFDSAIFKMLLPVVSGLEAVMVAARMNVTVPIATQCLTPPPPLADAIAAAAAKVANKYSAPLGRYADEIALCAIIATWQISAFAAMRRFAPIDTPSETPPPPPDKHESYQPPPPPPPPEPAKVSEVIFEETT